MTLWRQALAGIGDRVRQRARGWRARATAAPGWPVRGWPVRGWRPDWRAGQRRLLSAAAVLAVTVIGAVLGLAVGGHVTQDVGPFEARFSVSPTLAGGTEVRLPPLGSVHLDSHLGPAHLTIDLASLDPARTIDLFSTDDGVRRASATASDDVEHGVARLALAAAGAAVLGAMVLAAAIFRRVRRVALCGGLAMLLIIGSLGVAAATFRRESVAEPRYEGLLVNAPTVVGDVGAIANRYEEYRAQLQQLVTNVTRLYGTFTTLPVFEPASDTVRVLHISDLHLNPAAWSVIKTVVEQFRVDLVIDTGDITDWGSEPEATFINAIASLRVPYVYIRGNHDSSRTQEAVASQQNAVVLDNSVAEIAGLRIAGIGDPRFTPDKSEQTTDSRLVAGLSYTGRQLVDTIHADGGADIALVHDPASATPLAGEVPLVLAGHVHQRQVTQMPVSPHSPVGRTHLLVEGSTGGAGLRGLEGDEPLPLQLSVLYFGQDQVLKAYDAISVGGAGLAQVSLERHVVPAS